MRYTKYKIRNAKYEPQVTSHESRTKTGVTLVEMLIVVAIIALLVSTVISIATRTDNQAREQLAENTIAILTAALEQFHDYGYNYNESSIYANFDFPLDCNDFLEPDIRIALRDALAATNIPVISGGTHDPNYSGSEAMYFFLNRVPTSRKTLDKIDSSLITNIGSDGGRMNIVIDNKNYPLLRIIDPWGTTLRYSYYDGIAATVKTFPVITSAGPDRIFGTDDDISSR